MTHGIIWVGVTQAVTMLCLTGIFWLRATVWKGNVFFGVSVAPDAIDSPLGRSTMALWRTLTGIAGLALAGVAIVLSVVSVSSTTLALSVSGLLLLDLLAIVVVYLFLHHRVLALARPAGDDAVRAASLAPTGAGQPPWWWEALPLALIAATALALATRYASAPAIIPIHFGVNGQADAFASKSIGSYFALVWTQIGLWLLITLLTRIFTSSLTARRGPQSTGRTRTILTALYAVKVATIALMGGLALAIASANATAIQAIPATATAFVVLVVAIAGVAIARVGQQSNGDLAGGDSHWIGGVIYNNPGDPALFVERRVGVGYTINVGHPAGKALIAVLALVLVGSIVLAVTTGRHH